jgi:type II secretory pathway component GspD/PulD (secretin)
MKIAGRGSRVAGAFALMFVTLPVFGSISVRRSPYNSKTIDVYVVDERVSDAIGSIEMYLPKTVEMVLGEDPMVTYRAKEVSPEKALRALAAAAKLSLTSNDDQYWIRSTGDPTVTLDVKDAEAREILKSMQRQCGIKNLMIDPQVQGTGTFLFNQVPCRQAFTIVLQSMGLAAQTYSNNIVSVGAAQH